MICLTKTQKKEKAYKQAYREAHREELAVKENARYHGPKNEEIKKKNRDRYYANRDERLVKAKVYREANPEKVKTSKKRAMEKKREYYLQKTRDWGKANPHRVLAQSREKQTRKIQAILPTTDLDLIEKIYEQRLIMAEENGEEYHVDHIIPLSKGGAHHQDNLRIITAKENMEKGNKYIPELGGVWADNDLAREHKKKHGIE